jgi:hypothetical protein
VLTNIPDLIVLEFVVGYVGTGVFLKEPPGSIFRLLQ